MTLEEAIIHCKEKAEELNQRAESAENNGQYKFSDECKECANEHEQLAEWFEELVERREADKWIPVSERLPNDRDWCLGIFQEPDTGFVGIPYICDYVGKVTKGTTNEGWILRHCTDVDSASDYFRNLICVAWQTLPEPYQKGGAK